MSPSPKLFDRLHEEFRRHYSCQAGQSLGGLSPIVDDRACLSVKSWDGLAAILILGSSCSSSENVGIVRTSQRAKRARTVERAGII